MRSGTSASASPAAMTSANGASGSGFTNVTAPRTTWYLAEGATHSGFDLFYLLENPGDTQAEVKVE